jgi:ribonuclease BN (tRNA processing enzyme)
MRYFFKAISTNTRDMKTGILLTIEESRYLFNVPEGFCRIVASNNTLFSKNYPKYIFISSLHPNYFGGFSAYYLIVRNSTHLKDHCITILGPQKMKKLMSHSRGFLGKCSSLRFIEFDQK